VAMGSHGGGYADVELRNAIESGLVEGPRILAAGPLLDITMPGNAAYPLGLQPLIPDLVADGPGALRAGVRELAHYGVDHLKITTTGRFYFKPNGEMMNQALPSLDEIKAIVDEALDGGYLSPAILMAVTAYIGLLKRGSTTSSMRWLPTMRI